LPHGSLPPRGIPLCSSLLGLGSLPRSSLLCSSLLGRSELEHCNASGLLNRLGRGAAET
jgi:hypothetical protein